LQEESRGQTLQHTALVHDDFTTMEKNVIIITESTLWVNRQKAFL
jgi:hypothetical protein